MIVLIDADSLVYACCYVVETQEEAYAKFDEILMYIVNDIDEVYNVTDVKVFHGHTGNFRYDVTPTYKAQRKSEKPEFYTKLSKYVKTAYEAISAKGEEVDDLVAKTWKLYKKLNWPVCIVSIDKDYKQLPCLLYNYSKTKQTFTDISEAEARHNFWVQMLTGDRADNIKGVEGIGPKKAEALLEGCTGTISYARRVVSTYIEKYGPEGLKRAREAHTLLKIG